MKNLINTFNNDLKVVPFLILIIIFAFLSSCSKNEKVTPDPLATLDSGKAGISFNTNINFGTSTTFNVRNTSTTTAVSHINSITALRTIVLTAHETLTGSTGRSASVSVTLPVNANTSQGNLVGDLSQLGNPTVIASVYMIATPPGQGYLSGSGILTITKLTATEIEGTFDGIVGGPPTTYVISNGSFSGKFN